MVDQVQEINPPKWGGLEKDNVTSQNFTLDPHMQFNEGHVVSIVTYSILMVIAAVGNITVLVILLRRRRNVRSRINTMVMHLAIADLMVSYKKFLRMKKPPVTNSFFLVSCSQSRDLYKKRRKRKWKKLKNDHRLSV